MKRPRGPKTAPPPAPSAEEPARPDTDDESAEEDLLADTAEAPAVEEAALERILPGPEKHLVTIRDPVRRFVEEARRYARLDESDERELGHAARDRGDLDAARRLVVHNLRLVVAIAYQYRQAWLNVLDLFQEGSVGLMEAVRRWDPEVGTRFGSYAAYWIRAYVLRFLMTNARLIHVGNTRAGRKLFFRLEKERQKLLAAAIEHGAIVAFLLAHDIETMMRFFGAEAPHFEVRTVIAFHRKNSFALRKKLCSSGWVSSLQLSAKAWSLARCSGVNLAGTST